MSNFDIGRQPCNNFEPKRGCMSIRLEHECPSCGGIRAECASCNNDHHDGGWCSCQIFSLQHERDTLAAKVRELEATLAACWCKSLNRPACHGVEQYYKDDDSTRSAAEKAREEHGKA